MKVLITGGSGRMGRFIAQDLVAHGHEVVSLDLVPPPNTQPNIAIMTGNVARAEDVYGTLAYTKPQAIIHLAAWSNPGMVSDGRTYADNVAGSFNIFDAALALGIERVIYTSSAQVYGFIDRAPLFAPVTEDHPLRPFSAYALSKIAGEQAAAYFIAKGLDITTFRIMGVRTPETLAAEIERISLNAAIDLRLLWTRADARDIATFYRLAIESSKANNGIYNLSGPSIYRNEDARILLETHAPETDITHLKSGFQSPFSSLKAMQDFGYTPQRRLAP
ncbi:NAD-dependent epimerase/dehydratase family protein [Brucellaceae bacterium D45D]